MRRFILHKILPPALLLGMVFPLLAAAPQEYSDRQLKLIAQMTAQLLSRNHYRQQALDAGLSKQLFDEYLDELDPAKIYFTEEDVAKFSADRDLLCRQHFVGA